MPLTIWASSHTRECTPSLGFQWNFTRELSPAAFTIRKVLTPKPSIIRYDLGIPRSDMFHRLLFANAAAAALVGYPVEELAGHCEWLLLPSDTPRWRRFLRNAFDG